ncbi:hypothetical protein [Demequina rhizosphaerae]|uniref:hypothetical protein n=1 Tax=Demequina rhizosphaerae TaxID=1638985 RepID=UPI0007867405|nr:hypothetical protein [Demequina rhizosphaerae]
MTTWNNVVAFVGGNYKYEAVSDSLLKLLFTVDGGRSQIVFIERTEAGGVEWVQFHSPIGEANRLNLAEVATALGEKVVGGLIIMGEKAFVTTSIPLMNLDANEVVQPLEKVMAIADLLEAKFLGVDVH